MSVHDWPNIVLIGMPGVGKSTVGVILAKVARRQFIDTDVLMQTRTGRSLQEILDSEGLEAFCRIEEQTVCELACRYCVIATGGSVVYSDAAMTHLKAGGTVIHLRLPLELLAAHIANLDVRGMVMGPGESLADLYERRIPLYQRWADLTIDCTGKNQDQVVAAILARL